MCCRKRLKMLRFVVVLDCCVIGSSLESVGTTNGVIAVDFFSYCRCFAKDLFGLRWLARSGVVLLIDCLVFVR